MLVLSGLLLAAARPGHAGFREGLEAFQQQDYATALQELDAAADAGDKNAMFLLGQMYQRGLGTEADRERALELWTLAAEPPGADAYAQYSLAVMLESGDGAEPDMDRVVGLYRAAADYGIAAAMLNLGVLYAQGRGVERDRAAALRLFLHAMERGNATAATYFDSVSRSEGLEPPFTGSWQLIDFVAAPDRRAWQLHGDALEGSLGARLSLSRGLFRLGRAACGRPVFVADVMSASALSTGLTGATNPLAGDTDSGADDRPTVDVVCNGTIQATLLQLDDSHLVAPYAGGYAILAPVPSDMVSRAQRLLTQLGFDPGPVDGVYGPRTAAAVRDFREAAGMRRNGAVSTPLIRALDIAVGAMETPEEEPDG